MSDSTLDPSGWVASFQRRFILFSLPLSLPRSPRDRKANAIIIEFVAILDSSFRFGSIFWIDGSHAVDDPAIER